MEVGVAISAGVVMVGVVVLALALHDPFQPPNLPGSLNHLLAAEIIPIPGAFGPESLAFDSNGDGPYTGVADGRILKWVPHDRAWIDFAFTSSINRKECHRPFAPEMEHLCGRPLGLRFDKKSGDLYIADAYLGLHVVGPEGGLAAPVVTHVEGRPLYFTNDLDIDEEEGVIYFTDSSTVYHRREFPLSTFSGDETGRLLKYNQSSKQVTILLQDLAFPNGIALSEDRASLLVAESRACRVMRHWLVGPKAGTWETFVELPGFPDNIRRNQKGEVWIALHAKKGLFTNWILSSPIVGKMLLRLPLNFRQLHSVLVSRKPHATMVKVSEEGRVLEIIEDVEGENVRFISEAEEKDGKLWIGSVMTPFIGIHDLHQEAKA